MNTFCFSCDIFFQQTPKLWNRYSYTKSSCLLHFQYRSPALLTRSVQFQTSRETIEKHPFELSRINLQWKQIEILCQVHSQTKEVHFKESSLRTILFSKRYLKSFTLQPKVAIYSFDNLLTNSKLPTKLNNIK